jgi:omega-amidase
MFALLAMAAAAVLPVVPTPGRFKLALCQLAAPGVDKASNLRAADAAVRDAVASGAQVVSLPECFNSPYAVHSFPEYAENVPADTATLSADEHPTTLMLSTLAAELGIYLVGGSYPERDPATGKLYNTCVVFGPDGAIVARHRKVHLFDVDVPGKVTFKESDTLSSPMPAALSLFDTPWGRFGLGICYDIRFPQLATLMREAGAHVLIYPGAFNTFSGPLHWELLARARAVDTQSFVAVVSPARSEDRSAYQAWGHSSLVSPWGKVVATADERPATVLADVDVAEVLEPRGAIPVAAQKRDDLYELRWRPRGEAGGGLKSEV